jgi:hypothetical protein
MLQPRSLAPVRYGVVATGVTAPRVIGREPTALTTATATTAPATRPSMVRFSMRRLLAAAVVSSGFAVACSGGADERLDLGATDLGSADSPGANARSGSDRPADPADGLDEPAGAYAHVDVRVTERVDGSNSEVLAHFVYSSEQVYADSIASLNRPDQVLPTPGRCLLMDPLERPTNQEPSALLEAGAVTLRAAPLDSEIPSVEVSLAPRAFPGVSTLSPGVVYTSRDRQPLLPTGAAYEIDVQGGVEVPAMKLKGVAPAQLASVTVAGTPVGQVTSLVWGQPVDITWDVAQTNAGNAGDDLVYVDVTSKDAGQGLLRCAYLDSAGSGTLPWTDALARGLANDARATLNLHRHRRVASTSSETGSTQGELRFDFELTRDVTFVTAVPTP